MGVSNVRCLTTGFFTLSLSSEGRSLQVWGATSRGVFLHAASDHVLFLTPRPFRGPWTVNIAPQDAPHLEKLENGMEAHWRENDLHVPAADLRLRLSEARVWQPPWRPAILPRLQRELALLAWRKRPNPLLGVVLGESKGDGSPQHESIMAMRSALRQKRWQAIRSLARPLIGWGSGLTPSGDDLLLGMLLALQRWGDTASDEKYLASLHQHLTDSVRARSTAVSASLIDAAGQGHADERLIRALDALAGAPLPHEAVVDELLGWGNSSGLDALAGMLLVLDSVKL